MSLEEAMLELASAVRELTSALSVPQAEIPAPENDRIRDKMTIVGTDHYGRATMEMTPADKVHSPAPASPSVPPNTPSEPVVEVTLEALNELAVQYVKIKGLDAAKAVLKELGLERFGKAEGEKRIAAYVRLQKELAQ
jgi:hypothetical protein